VLVKSGFCFSDCSLYRHSTGIVGSSDQTLLFGPVMGGNTNNPITVDMGSYNVSSLSLLVFPSQIKQNASIYLLTAFTERPVSSLQYIFLSSCRICFLLMSLQDFDLQLSWSMSCRYIKVIPARLRKPTLVLVSISHFKSVHAQIRLAREVSGPLWALRPAIYNAHHRLPMCLVPSKIKQNNY